MGMGQRDAELLTAEVTPDTPRVGETMRIWQRALNEHWPIDPKLRETFVETARRVYEDPDYDARARIAAGKLIMDADKLNMVRARMALDVTQAVQKPQTQVNVQVNVGNLHSLSDAELERIIAAEGGGDG